MTDQENGNVGHLWRQRPTPSGRAPHALTGRPRSAATLIGRGARALAALEHRQARPINAEETPFVLHPRGRRYIGLAPLHTAPLLLLLLPGAARQRSACALVRGARLQHCDDMCVL
eukprot:1784804-Prymnesium_polylepis.1